MRCRNCDKQVASYYELDDDCFCSVECAEDYYCDSRHPETVCEQIEGPIKLPTAFRSARAMVGLGSAMRGLNAAIDPDTLPPDLKSALLTLVDAIEETVACLEEYVEEEVSA